MKVVAILTLLVALTGCRWVVKPSPVPAQCDALGWQVCKSRALWEADPADPQAWDALVDTLEESRAETRKCEVRRKALEQCLKRLEKTGVIVL